MQLSDLTLQGENLHVELPILPPQLLHHFVRRLRMRHLMRDGGVRGVHVSEELALLLAQTLQLHNQLLKELGSLLRMIRGRSRIGCACGLCSGCLYIEIGGGSIYLSSRLTI
jgi:hypothetical protein